MIKPQAHATTARQLDFQKEFEVIISRHSAILASRNYLEFDCYKSMKAEAIRRGWTVEESKSFTGDYIANFTPPSLPQ